MNEQAATEILKKIFYLSDRAMIHMVNHMFRTQYEDDESVMREWDEKRTVNIRLVIGCGYRYEFQMRCMKDFLQICAEDKGCIFCHEDAGGNSARRGHTHRVICFGQNSPDYSADLLADTGMSLFLPFLFFRFRECQGNARRIQNSLKYFVIHDIVGALQKSVRKGDLDIYDAQKLKQICRHMAWSCLAQEEWMQELEFQEELLEIFETDISLLERVHLRELKNLRNN